MAEAVMGPLVGRLQELAMSEARAMVAVNDDVRSLRDKLMWMQAFLREAEPRRRAKNDELIRVCLQQTRDAVFDAEDAVDHYFLQVDLSRYPNWSHAILKFVSGFTTQVRVRHHLSRRIKSINTRLEGIVENKGKYKIDDTTDDNSITTWRPSTAISAITENMSDFVLPLVGRETKIEELGDALFDKQSVVPVVICVTGKSGIGKTKLVKEIYKKPLTKRNFDVQVWVTCAPNLSATNIKKLILQRMTKDTVRSPTEQLQRKLGNKKYLVVIDGETSNTEWKKILLDLPKDKTESRVVKITHATKQETTVSGFKQHIIELNPIGIKDVTNMFMNTLLMDEKVGKKSRGQVEEALTRDGDGSYINANRIFKVTEGLPLAVVLLSGLLRTKEYPREWKKVFDHLEGKSNEWKPLDIILSMCLDDLPHDLKSCFLYFAGFPASTLVKARSLVCMWMAEGLLRPKEGKTMEKVGKKYLHELLCRGLMSFPPLENATPGNERVTVQTKVHEFLLIEAQEANFMEIHDGDDVPTLSNARRLTLQNHKDKYAALTDPLPKLRSIMSNFEKDDSQGSVAETKEEEEIAGANACSPIPLCLRPHKDRVNSKDHMRKLLQGSQFLRVICLCGLEVGSKLPSEIGSLVHLQYLGITYCFLNEIPSSVGNLTRLQTLDVQGTSVTKLRQELWRIPTLRHVFGFIVLPRRVGDLEQLQTLEAVKPDDAGVTASDSCWDAKTFANMKRLHSLYIWDISNKNVKCLEAVYGLKYLVLLSIQGKVISLDLFTRSKLSRLQEMVLKGKIVAPTTPLTASNRFFFPTLTKLSLNKTKVSKDFIDRLSEDLPLLATLALFRDSYSESCLVFTNGFHSLKELTLDVYLEEIVIKEEACPDLMKLEVVVHYLNLCIDIPNKPSLKDTIQDMMKQRTIEVNRDW